MEKLARRGGARPGAGRPRKSEGQRRLEGLEWKGDVPHRARPALDGKTPVHVTMRSLERSGFRRETMHRAVVGAMAATQSEAFRIVHLSIQDNHLHLIVEAASKTALSKGMHDFTIRVVLGFHRRTRGVGQLFGRRYHAVQLKTPLQVYRALNYVLNNWRHHFRDRDEPHAALDRYSSATRFGGWTGRRAWKAPAGYVEMPVAAARTALLREKWKGYGLIDPWDVPGKNCWRMPGVPQSRS